MKRAIFNDVIQQKKYGRNYNKKFYLENALDKDKKNTEQRIIVQYIAYNKNMRRITNLIIL